MATHAQLEAREPQAEHDRTERGRRSPDPAVAAVLELQRGAGNQAVARVLARRTQPKPQHTGMRDDGRIAEYVRKAVIFIRNNPTAPLNHFARFLGAAANVQLNTLGVPDMNVVVKANGGGGAHFSAEFWQMFIDEDGFTHREGVTTLGELTDDEAAIIAMNVWHEARHAEQRFRVARVEAGAGRPIGFPQIDADVGEAAEAQPLTQRAMPAHEVRETEAWRENQLGEDSVYRQAVTGWQSEVRQASRLAHGVAPEEVNQQKNPLQPADVRDQIGRMLKGWNKPGAGMEVVRTHLPSAERRKRTTMIADIKLMIQCFATAQAELAALPAQPGRADFAKLADALRQLVRAIDAAYRNQPVEKDAHETGGAAFDAFHGELAKQRAAKP
ncbi:hypothetical protein OJ997_07435 [Solirubrobacter phytolaccae]|uniref:Uncharacterized protein n=1 Tax=Solirubrobacter phytolaccae TaxID=1404360 RepID=A0A9X3SE62_9ACTN|nr:hypothetical protein [Solirubrobacter phytolaccae]MDA0180122.1 hypothetical protein [Solirubrobacter phytolaccae]